MNIYRKTGVLLAIICSILLMPFAGFATEETIPLYEKYDYMEEFKYDDVSIAHALKTTVPLILHRYTGEVSYEAVKVKNNEIEAFLNGNSELSKDEKLAYINNNISDFLVIEKEIINISSGTRGSGVVISENGYIATNAHVVHKFEEKDRIAFIQEAIQKPTNDSMNKLISDLGKYGLTLTENAIEQFRSIIFNSMRVDNEAESYHVCLPSYSGATNIDEERTYEAQVIKEGVGGKSNERTTQDAAILKIDEDNLVAMKLSDSYPETNSKITSAGFPAVANEIFAEGMDSGASILSATIGSGNIARLIPIDGTNYKAMEITTTIAGGSSGGPSVDETLDIEGLNTYSSANDVRFAYMVPAEYIRDMVSDVPIEQGEVTKIYLTGLQMLQKKKGAEALECFKAVQKMRPETPYIETLIQSAEELYQKNPIKEPKSINGNIVLIFIVVVGVLILIIAIVVICVTISKGSKEKNIGSTPHIPPVLTPPATVEIPSVPNNEITRPLIDTATKDMADEENKVEFPCDENVSKLRKSKSFTEMKEETANKPSEGGLDTTYGASGGNTTGTEKTASDKWFKNAGSTEL